MNDGFQQSKNYIIQPDFPASKPLTTIPLGPLQGLLLSHPLLAPAEGRLPLLIPQSGLLTANFLNPIMFASLIDPFLLQLQLNPYNFETEASSKRKNATREGTAPLKEWMNSHRNNPYPSKRDKMLLAVQTRMSLTQVSTWFANARRRLKKENKMTWSEKDRKCGDEDENTLMNRPCSLISVETEQKEKC